MSAAARPRGLDHGDRHAFLAQARVRADRGAAVSAPGGSGAHVHGAHPLPPGAEGPDGFVPIAARRLDPADLTAGFVAAARAVLLDVRTYVADTVPDVALEELVEEEAVRRVVVSADPLAREVGARLQTMGVEVLPYSAAAAAAADLGVSAPVAGIAATGSLVQDSAEEGCRGISLLPRVHLALLPAPRIVASTAEVLARFGVGSGGAPMPANVVLITGPSRTGDIEMILTVGVHGPVRVVVAVLVAR